MFNELWFVPLGKYRLAGMRKPENISEVKALKQHNVVAIISLLDDKENHELYNAADMPFLWLPVTGGTAMTTAQAQTASDYLNAQLANQPDNAIVAVHCSNGHKRTGMLLTAMQITNGTDYPAALANVIDNNPKAQAMNDQQRNFLSKL